MKGKREGIIRRREWLIILKVVKLNIMWIENWFLCLNILYCIYFILKCFYYIWNIEVNDDFVKIYFNEVFGLND